jgi:hypothetical protein
LSLHDKQIFLMKIHSSSLTFSHASLSRQQVGKQSSAQSKDEIKELLSIRNSHDGSNSLFPSYPPEEIRQSLDISELNSTKDLENSVPPRDIRVLRALTAYSEEFNKLLVDQHTRVAPGIDAYV